MRTRTLVAPYLMLAVVHGVWAFLATLMVRNGRAVPACIASILIVLIDVLHRDHWHEDILE